MIKNKYKSASIFYLIGNFFNKGLSFITIPVYTRILTQDDYGMTNTFFAWVSIVTLVIGMALHMGLRAAFSDDKNPPFSVLSTIIVFCSVLYLFILIILKILFFVNVFTEYELLINACLTLSYSYAIISYYKMYLMMTLKYKLRTFILIIPPFLGNIFSMYIILNIDKYNNYNGRIYPFVILNLIITLIILISVYKKNKLYFNKSYLKEALKISSPLILHGISLSLLSQSDRVMITYFEGSSKTAVYSVMYNIGIILTLIYTSLDGVWVPWFTKKMKEGSKDEISTYGSYYINLMTFLAIVILFLSPEIVKILAPNEYWFGISLIPPILISSIVILMYTLLVNIEHYLKETKIIARNTIIAATTNVTLNFFLIPKMGFEIAAYTTLISYLISFSSHYLFVRKINISIFKLKTFIVALMILLSTSIIFMLIMSNLYSRLLFLFIVIIIYLLFNRKVINKLILKK